MQQQREIPILFSTPMVQAILEWRKGMTRRTRGLKLINDNIDDWEFVNLVVNAKGELHAHFWNNRQDIPKFIKCPYGKPGDILWVRESFCHYTTDTGFEIPATYRFKTDENITGEEKWKPSIHMPKEAARIWLQVEEVRLERLQDISEEDARNEGVEKLSSTVFGKPLYMDYMGDEPTTNTRVSFETLWESINGAESWDANPWVWVVKFKFLSTSSKPTADATA